MAEKKHDKIKHTIYLSEALLWKMREFGVGRRINSDGEMISQAILHWMNTAEKISPSGAQEKLPRP